MADAPLLMKSATRHRPTQEGVFHRGPCAAANMRWVGLLLLLLAHNAVPFAHANPAVEARSDTMFDAVAPSDVVVHRNETVTTYITVHNRGTVNQELRIEPLSIPAPLDIVGLPVSEVVVPNHLRQLTFGIHANASAAFQNLTATFIVTSDIDPTANKTIDIEVMIAPYSNLSFGVEGVSELIVDENVRTAVAVNISNNASYSDNVTFSLYSASGWTWGWDMVNTVGDVAYSTIGVNQLRYVYFWIEIPSVENGKPLANSGPRFTLSATSALDRAVTQWSVDLKMNEKRNASIDAVESELTVAPNQDGRLYAVVRNVGNTPNTLNITLQATDSSGQLLPSTSPSDRFNESGWVVALFGGLEDVSLEPNESRTIEIGFQAPNAFSGSVHVQLQVFANGAKALLRTAQISATIERTVDVEATYSESGCENIKPNESCSVSLSIKNTGNAYNTYLLRAGEVTDGFTVDVPAAPRLVQAGANGVFDDVLITADDNAVAFWTGSAVVEVLGDDGTVLTTVSVPLKVAPEIKWTFRNVEEQVDAKGRLNIAMEVRNEGNAVDGLIVQLQSSHLVDMGFIPPENAVFEDGLQYPRSFEINDIPLNSNFTIRAWVQLPQDQPNNGTVFVNTTIRSRFAPELPFVHTSSGGYLGQPWQPQPDEDQGVAWGEMAATAVAYIKAWSGVLLAIAFAGLVIYKAVVDRERRLEHQQVLPYQETSTADDWMKQFEKEPEAVEPVRTEPLQAVPKETYEAMFRHAHGQPAQAQSPVEPGLVNAATIVLDQRTEERNKAHADDMLAALQRNEIASPPAILEPEPAVQTSATSEATPTERTPKAAPQRSPVDDLEF